MSGSGSSIILKLEELGHESLTAVEHSAAWLVGRAATTTQSLTDLTESSPLVKQAWVSGVASATAHGIPVAEIEHVGEAILSAARQLAAGLSQPAPTAPAAT